MKHANILWHVLFLYVWAHQTKKTSLVIQELIFCPELRQEWLGTLGERFLQKRMQAESNLNQSQSNSQVCLSAPNRNAYKKKRWSSLKALCSFKPAWLISNICLSQVAFVSLNLLWTCLKWNEAKYSKSKRYFYAQLNCHEGWAKILGDTGLQGSG